MSNAKHLQVFMTRLTSYLVVLLPGIGYSTSAFAYLDPGTGSIILQGLVAGIMVAVAAWGVFWQRIKSFLSSIFSKSESTEDTFKDDSG